MSFNVLHHINRYGDCETFVPTRGKPTDFPPGSAEKLEILAQRVLNGEEIHHPDDRPGYEDLNPGCVKPREKPEKLFVKDEIKAPNFVKELPS